MPYLDVDPKNINQEAGKLAFDAVEAETEGRIREPDSLELWEVWYRAYVQNGGEVRVIEEKGTKYSVKMKCEPSEIIERLKTPKPPKPRAIPPLTLTIIELEFLSDHKIVKDNTVNWENTGALYVKPDWRADKSNYISHSINEKVQIRIVVKAEGEAPDTGRVGAKFKGKGFFISDEMTFQIGNNEIRLTSEDDFFKAIICEKVTFQWRAVTSRRPESTSIGDTENFVLATFSKPAFKARDELTVPEPEEEFSVKRMQKAIELIRATGETDPHKIVLKLMRLFRSYTLERNLAVPEEFGHPQYTHAKAGAWAMADYIIHTAECQAICRFVRAVLEQVGCPGTVESIVVWEDPLENAVKEAAYGSSRSGLRFVTKSRVVGTKEVVKTVSITEEPGFFDGILGKKPVVRREQRRETVNVTESWRAFLTTSAPTLGEDASDCGLNLYEACLKFTHAGRSKYHGGGAGMFNSKEEVIRAFDSLIWVHQVVPEDIRLPARFICKEIVKTY